MPRCKTILFTLTILAVLGGAFIINPSTAKALTAEELRAQIDALIRQLNALQAQLAEMQPPTEVWCHDFNVNLRIGDRGEEILSLKTALIKDGVWPYMAVGNEFDEETASYVVGFQEKYASEVLAPWGLAHGTGFVGATTRAKLNTLYGCEAVTWKTYKDEKFAFRTSYPSNVTPRVSYSSVTWDLERDGRISFWAEKDSSETQSMSFKDFAIHLARNLCAADGPMGSIYCTDPIDLAEFTNQQDIWGYKFYITQIEQSNCNKVTGGCDEEISKKGPIVVFRYPEGSAYRGAYLEVFENIPAKAYTTHVFNQMLSTFKFIEAETPPITVLSPNGGEEWVIGNSYTITWNHSGVNEVGIYLLDFEGIGEEILINRFVSVSPSTYSWAITNNISAGDKYKIELRGYYGATSDEYISDESDNHFSIVAASGTCTDTDGGKVYDVKGTVEANDKTYTDYCAGAFWLKEYSCSSSGDVVEEGVICPNNGSCKDGACVEAPTEVICTDTDNGKDYYTKGTTRWGPISGKYNTATDGCSSDGKTLSEFHCYYSENLKGYYSGTSYYTCPNGCQDGACKLGVKLSSQNPNSHEVAAGATTSPISGSSEISHRFLVFEVDNPSNQTVNIKRLAVSLEGTASPYDFGEVLWQVDGRSIGYSYFGSNGYADIPDYTTQTPLLTIAPKTKKTVEVFAFVKSTASEGSTAKFVMSGTGMIYITADGFNFGGMPISGNTMTITKKTLSAGMKYQGTYSMNALAGNTISAVVTLTNKSSEEMKLTELAMGNPSDGNTFLNYIDKDSYTVGTSKLRDMGRSNSTGYRIFSILPSISLPAKSTISYAVSGRLNRTVPVSQISITFNEFAGYGTSSLSPVRTSGVLTGKINISGGATGYKDISNSLADISSTLSRLIEAFKQDILGR